MILLDGLDEVKGQEREWIIEEVESFCYKFHNNRFVITCRTQGFKYKLGGFTDVEIAKLKPKQVEEFINRWFDAVASDTESRNLAKQLIWLLRDPENKPITDLAVTPVLLNLICLVFRKEKGNLPKNRAKLYEMGLRDLLEGLDEKLKLGVYREPVYEKLTPDAREDLLIYLATTLFEENDYFPEQETLEKLIFEYLTISRVIAKKVLRSIEEQTGLLIERSEGFWSFSHLTFQEYFTARWFCDRADWQGLAKYVKEKHWRQIFLLAVEMGKSRNKIDSLLLLMKEEVDKILSDENKFQKFL